MPRTVIAKPIGSVFGKWTVVGPTVSVDGKSVVACRCDCGTERQVRSDRLSRGETKSCGKCGVIGTRTLHEYQVWRHMRERCSNPNQWHYHRYGGRGIKVCDRWKTFANFYADMGPRPSTDHSLDRIDNDGDYSPENCRWATRHDQNRNRCNNRMFSLNGETLCLTDWATRLGIDKWSIIHRLERGWSLEDALTKPRGYRLIKR